jgi:hypothetical protein
MIFLRALIVTLSAMLIAAPLRAATRPPTQILAQSLNPRMDGGDRDEDDRQSQARARGIVNGSVVGVDFALGILRLQTGRGILDIFVQPGTSIVRRKGEYATIADLTRGAHVAVYVSQVGPRLIAQLIQIR